MKVVFACVENSCRSQMAEALAKKLYPDQGMEFVSAGTRPDENVNKGVIEVLKGEGIAWKGHPKDFSEIGEVDLIVTMGCDVECPFFPGVKTVEWDIIDPKGKDKSEYQIVFEHIKDNVIQLVEDIIKQK